VVDAVRHGLSNRQIAERRGVSLDAIKFHVANPIAKLGLNGRAELRSWRGVPADSALNRTELCDGVAKMGPLDRCHER
jgi:DNA-binding NarL/FixJ family response regulator